MEQRCDLTFTAKNTNRALIIYFTFLLYFLFAQCVYMYLCATSFCVALVSFLLVFLRELPSFLEGEQALLLHFVPFYGETRW